MKKKLSIWVWVCIVVIMFVLGAAILTRLSYTNGKDRYINEVDDFSVGIFLPDEEKVKVRSNLNKLENESDLIIKANMTSRVQELEEYTLSEVKIIEVYKGDPSLVGEKIKIYEPAIFIYYHQQYSSTDFYNLMDVNREYILFLKPLNYPKELNIKKEQTNSYFLSSTTYGKYDINSNNQIPVITDYEKVKYRDVKSLDIITNNEDIIDNYFNFIVLDYF